MEPHVMAALDLSAHPLHQQQQHFQPPQRNDQDIHDYSIGSSPLARYPGTLPHHDLDLDMPQAAEHASSRLPTPEAKHKRAPRACEAIFLAKGQHSNARNERHPRPRDRTTKPGNKRNTAQRRRSNWEYDQAVNTWLSADDIWNLLPPVEDMVEAVHKFTTHYFQLGFTHKDQYPRSIGKQRGAEHLFLLLSILSVSARLSPALVKRYGTGDGAVEFFKEKAAKMADARYKHISLEDCQAFYLLSIAQHGDGEQNDSHRNLGLAIHKATGLRLHREEHLSLHSDAAPGDVIRKESARRTFWMLHSQDSLHSGQDSPKSFCEIDITALLPGDEASFSAGKIPETRAALQDTVPGCNKSLVNNPNRSLFATQIQVYHWWGKVRRRATTYSLASASEGETAKMINQLADWELRLPPQHKWDAQIHRQMKAERLDLAYIGVTMMVRACNIVIRRSFLQSMVHHYTPQSQDVQVYCQTRVDELFDNVFDLYGQVEALFTGRRADEKIGYHMAGFCVYLCGLHVAYICKYHHLYSDRASVGRAPLMLAFTRSVLQECEPIWPFAKQWSASLDAAAQDPSAAEGHPVAKQIKPEPCVPGSEAAMSTTESTAPLVSQPSHLQTPQEDVASSFSSSAAGYASFFNAGPPVTYPSSTFLLQHDSGVLQPYFPPASPQQQQQNGLNMLALASQSPTQGPSARPQQQPPFVMAPQSQFHDYVPPYDMATASAVAAATGEVPYLPEHHHQQQHAHTAYHQLEPVSDGFDQQLASYIKGTSTDWTDAQHPLPVWVNSQQ
ncbi:putative transcriptional regulatory protein -like protein [Emericellopsis cladophorae]|uniref:Transcriptional regulatory protein -like protein n=1 Tax=Emericellopsis cladophorae TaxID=2686198 RepID=A0A9P9Y2T7_9HYPO|nr:putative transcriptional regulatory protein -like protein [Emericellopsis cladophorae]KAI6782563.1 putative transcriptional regulatory protein -like protein [Emericellopsis cladophorae]